MSWRLAPLGLKYILILKIRIDASYISRFFCSYISYIQKLSFENLLALPQAKDVNVKKLNILETKKMKIFDLFDDKRVNF